MTPIDEIEDEIELGGCLEAEPQRDNVGVQHPREEVALRLDIFRMVLLKDAFLWGWSAYVYIMLCPPTMRVMVCKQLRRDDGQ